MHISRKDFAIIKRTPTPLKKTLNLLIVRNSYTFIHNIILTIYITILNFIYIYISIHPFPIIKFQKRTSIYCGISPLLYQQITPNNIYIINKKKTSSPIGFRSNKIITETNVRNFYQQTML